MLLLMAYEKNMIKMEVGNMVSQLFLHLYFNDKAALTAGWKVYENIRKTGLANFINNERPELKLQ